VENRRVVALFPIKQESVRISNKNFRLFSGRPLFSWMLDTILSLAWIDSVIINTDAQHILVEYGITSSDRIIIRERAPALLGNSTSMNLIIEDDIAAAPADMYLMTHATNPLLTADTITAAAHQYELRTQHFNNDSLFSVTSHRIRFFSAEGIPVNHDPTILVPTQDLAPLFAENSCLYIFSPDSFSVTRSRIGANPFLYSTPLAESIDIDDEESWNLAQSLHSAMNNRHQ